MSDEGGEQRKLIERIAKMLFEPLELPEGCPPLGERIIGAIDMLYRERTSAQREEHEALALLSAWRPVVRSALVQAAEAAALRAAAPTNPAYIPEYVRATCRETERAAEALTADQREAAEP